MKSDFARGCTLIDTPGILAGRKQTDRNYSYEKVLQWFAPRADIILLMFDAHKVDISDEFRDVIKLLEGYDDKIRVVLNKADALEPSDLLKVNSALTWALARILRAPEVRRIYVGSFWDQPLRAGNFMNTLFEKEAVVLLHDLATAPRNNATAKLNDLITRARRVRVQALLFHELRSAMPKMTGKDRKQKELIASLEDVFFRVMKTHNVPVGDFPDVAKFRHVLANHEGCRDFTKFKKIDEKQMAQLDLVIREHCTALMTEFEAIPTAAAAVVPSPSHEPAAPFSVPAQAAPPPPSDVCDPWSNAPAAAPPPPAKPPIDPWASQEGGIGGATAAGGGGAADPWAADSSDEPPTLPTRGMSGVVDDMFGVPRASAEDAEAAKAEAAKAEAAKAEAAKAEAMKAEAEAARAEALAEARAEAKAQAAAEAAKAEALDEARVEAKAQEATAAAEAAAPEAAPIEPARDEDTKEASWGVSASEKAKFDAIFAQMGPENGLVSGAKVAPVLKQSGLTNDSLKAIWNLVDTMKDGVLDADYFAVAMHLTMRTKRGHPLPEVLPPELVPPAHR